MLHSPPPHLHPDTLLKNHQRLIPLTLNPLIRLLSATSIRRHKQPRPEPRFASSLVAMVVVR